MLPCGCLFHGTACKCITGHWSLVTRRSALSCVVYCPTPIRRTSTEYIPILTAEGRSEALQRYLYPLADSLPPPKHALAVHISTTLCVPIKGDCSPYLYYVFICCLEPRNYSWDLTRSNCANRFDNLLRRRTVSNCHVSIRGVSTLHEINSQPMRFPFVNCELIAWLRPGFHTLDTNHQLEPCHKRRRRSKIV